MKEQERVNDSTRYQQLEEIGRGGMGQVYRAVDTFLDRPVAVKQLAPGLSQQADLLIRLQEEARLLAQLEHAHIVPIYDMQQDEAGPLRLIMRFAAGGTLRQKLAAGALDSAELLTALGQVAQALDAAHQQGIVHGDVKPSNILFDEAGVALLSDFGLGQWADDIDRSGKSTAVYISPERAQGQRGDGRSDQYSLAILAYEALAGRPPFVGSPEQLLVAHQSDPVPTIQTWNAALPATVDATLSKALAKEASARFSTTADFVAALQEALNHLTFPLPLAADKDMPTPTPQETDASNLSALSAEELSTIEQVYEQGMAAMKRQEWAAAVDAFNQVIEIDRHYRSALTLRQTAKRNLENSRRATAVEAPAATNAASKVAEGRRIVSGAGGSASSQTAPEGKRSRKWLWLSIPLLLLAVVAGLFVWRQRSMQPTAQIVPTVTANDTPITTANSITILSTEHEARWQVDGVDIEVTKDNLVPIPTNGQSLVVQTSSPLNLQLPDGSELSLEKGATLEISSVANVYEATETNLIVQQGQLVAKPSSGLVIKNPYGAQAALSGGLVGIAFSEEPFRFDVDCLLGECQVAGDLEGEVTLAGGEYSFVGGSGQPAEPDIARYELYSGLSAYVPTATPAPPTQTATVVVANVEPTAVVATATPSRTPTAVQTATATATPTETPTETPTVVFVQRPSPTLTRFTCSNPGNYTPSESIPFEWSWSGRLSGSEYLELRVGPKGSTNLSSIGTVPAGANNVWTVDASTFFTMAAFDYHWEVVHMSGNGRTVLARSARGCLHIAP